MIIPVGWPPSRPAGRLQHEPGLRPDAAASAVGAVPVVIVAVKGTLVNQIISGDSISSLPLLRGLVEGGDGGAAEQQRLEEGQLRRRLRLRRMGHWHRQDLDVQGRQGRTLLVLWLLQKNIKL